MSKTTTKPRKRLSAADRETLTAAESQLGYFSEEIRAIAVSIGREWVRVGILLAQGAALLESVPALMAQFGSPEGWARTVLPEYSGGEGTGGIWGSSPAYRALQAGRVALVLGDDVGDASVAALVPLHRVISGVKPEDQEKAETKVRTLWTRAGKRGTPTLASITKVLDGMAGTRGKPKGSEKTPGSGRKGKGKASAKPATTQAEPELTQKDLSAIGQKVAGILKNYPDESRRAVLLAMHATAALCIDFGAANVSGVILARLKESGNGKTRKAKDSK